ncbi:MAG: serine/threonine protein kinase, partial [Myxococcales bacterium]|nr:serine/threonine protein kinase [Myxococcales bacterium]
MRSLAKSTSSRLDVGSTDFETLSSDRTTTSSLASDDIEVLAESTGADPLIGRIVSGRYRIRRRIGRGGMGVVYEVEHTAIGKLLAMKLLSGELAQSPEVVARFEREALAASRLQSHNTVQVFDYGTSDGLTFLVMELVQGESLSSVLKREGPMAGRRLAKIVVQICNALAEAHQAGVVHRDVKPDNVMLVTAADGSDVVKVLDFGLAKLKEAAPESRIISQGMLLGTPHYMAPEQIRGEPIDGQADVYGVGALMYVALTGKHAFSGRPTEVLTAHLTTPPLSPDKRYPSLGIDPELGKIVTAALQKDPAARPDGAAGMRERVAEFLRLESTPSIEALLDEGFARELSASPAPRPALATRDDVDSYERRLRTRRYGWAVAMAIVSMGVFGIGLWLGREPDFDGWEREPNDRASEASPLPIGAGVHGELGRRLDPVTADRDFYALAVPSSGRFDVELSPLPNVGLCLSIYGRSANEPIAQWCKAAATPLSVSLPLDAGDYHLLVTQNLDHAPAPIENVSDRY